MQGKEKAPKEEKEKVMAIEEDMALLQRIVRAIRKFKAIYKPSEGTKVVGYMRKEKMWFEFVV